MKKLIIFTVFITFSMLWPNINMNGQGVWVEQITDTDTDNHLFDTGEDCLGYAKENTQYIYFFDVISHNWVIADLGSEQVVRNIEGKGNIIIAYTDDIIIGYSSLTSGFDTLHYQGELINPDATYNDPARAYGCNEQAAFFVTDEYFYVYDGVLGNWKSYAYTLPLQFQNNAAKFIKGDDYIGVVLPEDITSSNYVINMAYSLPHHTFAFTDEGGVLYSSQIISYPMSHGFVTRLPHYNEPVVYLGGYSSLTNTFSGETVLIDPYVGINSGSWSNPENISDKTSAVFIMDDDMATQHIYAYSTFSGLWDVIQEYHDPDLLSSFSAFNHGGSLSVAFQSYYSTNEVNYLVFDSETGEFHTINSIANQMIAPTSPFCGSDAMVVSDSTRVWFYNPSPIGNHFQDGFHHPDLLPITGDNYIAVTTWDLTLNNSDIVYIYNSQTDQVTDIDIGFVNNVFYPVTSLNMFAFAVGPGTSNVYLYSAISDTYTHIPMTPNSFASIELNNCVALVQSQNGNEAYLYNGNNNFTSTVNFLYDFDKLGENIALFTKGTTAHVYNFNLNSYSDIEVSDYMGSFWATGNIGLVSNLTQEEFYAYNGYSDNWVELEPLGASTPYAFATNKTALVIRNDRIYAFDPQIPLGTDEPVTPESADGFELMQNYPNPFSIFTQISYTLNNSGNVSLKIYDVTGGEVTELINEYKTAGKYSIRLNTDKLSAGVYYYSLMFNSHKQSKKMFVF